MGAIMGARVYEGKVILELPEYREFKGPGSADMPVFYNPTMRVDRDLLVAVVKFYAQDGWMFLDGLAASGIRALRVGKESGKNLELHACDINPLAVENAQHNASLNGIKLHLHHRDLNSLIPELKPHFIDIDTFGTPVPFLDVAVQYVRTNGIIAITSTDTSPLVGTHPRTCMRRYWARSHRVPQKHEVALRILLGYVARTAAKYDRGIVPLLSFRGKHFYRVYFMVRNGVKAAEDTMKLLGYLDPNDMSLYPWKSFPFALSSSLIGPLWTGELEDQEFVEFLLESYTPLEVSKGLISEDTLRLIKYLRGENISFLYYELSWECKKLKVSPPPMSLLRRAILSRGYKFGRTHFSLTGIKTDMPPEEFRDLLLNLATNREK